MPQSRCWQGYVVSARNGLTLALTSMQPVRNRRYRARQRLAPLVTPCATTRPELGVASAEPAPRAGAASLVSDPRLLTCPAYRGFGPSDAARKGLSPFAAAVRPSTPLQPSFRKRRPPRVKHRNNEPHIESPTSIRPRCRCRPAPPATRALPGAAARPAPRRVRRLARQAAPRCALEHWPLCWHCRVLQQPCRHGEGRHRRRHQAPARRVARAGAPACHRGGLHC